MVLVVKNGNSDRPLLLFFCIDWILGSKYVGVLCVCERLLLLCLWNESCEGRRNVCLLAKVLNNAIIVNL
jgi:hypothetical protein